MFGWFVFCEWASYRLYSRYWGPLKISINMLTFLISILSLVITENSVWQERQCIDLPKGIVVYEGVTKSGNPKYWLEFDQIGKVTVSPSNAKSYKSGSITLQLVKWYNKDTNSYKYTIRKKKGVKQTKNIDLLTIFKQ